MPICSPLLAATWYSGDHGPAKPGERWSSAASEVHRRQLFVNALRFCSQAHAGGTSEDGADKSKRQSLQCIKFPSGYSNSSSCWRVKPTFLQMALDGPFSTDGKAWMNRCLPSDRALSTTAAVALVATPCPWNSGSTLQPVSHTCCPCQSFSQYPIDPAATLSGPTTITNMPPLPESRLWRYRRWRWRIFSGVSGPPRCSVITGSPISRSRSGRSPSDHGRMSIGYPDPIGFGNCWLSNIFIQLISWLPGPALTRLRIARCTRWLAGSV